MNYLYDLVTRIDALTANSQQVLNALIRSCVASGSSSGYKVNKYGVPIVLDRADIYHLYDFYQSWEAEGFPSDESLFNSLLARANDRWRTGPSDTSTLATDAVVKHSKILYLTREEGDAISNSAVTADSESQSEKDYWVAKIRESASPKGTVSSAPIPLNLRTPLYDETLSVKSFSQFETYLFPMGYHRADILGTPGNGEDYIAGGRNWTIDASDTLLLSGNHIVMGRNSNPPNKTDGYGDSELTISWGKESYAFGSRSLSFGDHSVAKGNCATVFGYRGYGQGNYSFVAGGERDISVLQSTFSTNAYNTAVGINSFAANNNNYAGGWGYGFTFIASESGAVQTECDTEQIETENVCISNKSIVDATGETSLYKVIRIPYAQVAYACMDFDMRVGDQVVIYDMWLKDSQGNPVLANDLDGYASSPCINRIANITAVYKDGDSSGRLDYYEITLAQSVPVTSRYGLFSGGTISSYARYVTKYDIDGNSSGTRNLVFGQNSVAFGHGNSARGENQTVVGQMGVPNPDAKFIVGAGCSYIGADDDIYRSNALVVGELYSYMKLAGGKSYIGMAAAPRVVPDKCAGADKLVLERGTVMKTVDPVTHVSTTVATDDTRAYMSAAVNAESVARVAAGTRLEPYFASDYPTSVLQSLQGTAVVTSGAYVYADDEDVGERNLVDTLLHDSDVIRNSGEHGVAIYARDGIDIRNTNPDRGINIETCSYLSMTFKGILLQGDTFRSLPATDKSLSFRLDYKPGKERSGTLDSVYWGHATGCSGFYFIDGKDGNARLFNPDIDKTTRTKYDGTNIHLINSGVYDADTGKYHVASLALPETFKNSDQASLRPTVTAGELVKGVGGGTEGSGSVAMKEIPYIDDVSVWAAAPMSNFGYEETDANTHSAYLVTANGRPNVLSGPKQVVMPVFTCAVVNADMKWVKSDEFYAGIDDNPDYPYLGLEIKILHRPVTPGGVVSEYGTLSVSASINGNTIDIYGSWNFNMSIDSIRGFRIPFIPGFATVTRESKFGIDGVNDVFAMPADYLYKKKSAGQKDYIMSYLSGEPCWKGKTEATQRMLNVTCSYGGAAIQDGILAVDILNNKASGTMFSDAASPYSFHVHGAVPFEATGDCVGTMVGRNIKSSWNKALDACYNHRVLMPYDILCTLMEDEDN